MGPRNNYFIIKRRIFIIPFEYRFTQEEIRPQHEIIAEFSSERSGILSWAVEGARRWFKRRGLKVPKEVLETTREYFLENNLIEQYLTERCTVYDKDDINTVGITDFAKDLYNSYLDFINDLNEDKLGRNQFYSRLEELGYKRAMSSNQQLTFRGIKLRRDLQPESVSANASQRKDLPE